VCADMTPFRARFQQRLLKFVAVRLQRTATQPQLTAAPCNSLQFTATHRNPLQHNTPDPCSPTVTMQHTSTAAHCKSLQVTAFHCSSLQLTATHCNSMQHNTLQSNTPAPCPPTVTLQHAATAAPCNSLQLSPTHCNTTHCNTTHCNTTHLLHVP